MDMPQIVPMIETALVRSAELKRLKLAEQNLNVALSRERATSVTIGLIMESYRLDADVAFEVLHQYDRSQRRRLDGMAAQMVSAAEEIKIPPKTVGLVRKAPDKTQN